MCKLEGITTTTKGFKMEFEVGQVVKMNTAAIDDAKFFSKSNVPSDGCVTVAEAPDGYGGILVKWPGATFWVNEEWLEEYSADETVTLSLDARTMNGLSDIFFDWYTIDVDAAIEKVRSMGEQK